MGMDVGPKGKVKSDINVVPLVDIVLVLLIIFIVITPAISNAVALPLSKHSETRDPEAGAKYLSLILTRDETPVREWDDPRTKTKIKLYKMKDVQVDDKNDIDPATGQPYQFSFDDKKKLVEFVRKNVANLYADKRVFIKADAQLPYYYVNELLQICREAGADEASIVTAEDKSGEEA